MALFHFLVLSLCISCCKVDARSKTLPNDQNHFTASDSTMREVDNNIDCVDIYKQPALQHPLLKNHKIQLYPTFSKTVVRSRPSYDHECPTGKVPIYNWTRRHEIVNNSSSNLQIEDLRHYAESTNGFHTVSVDTTQNWIFYGGKAAISGYNLSLERGQISTSSVWVEGGPPTELNSIHAGVGVRPDLYGDSQIRLTTLWTAYGSKNTGCSDTLCPGFVQVTQDKFNMLGSVVFPATRVGSVEKYILEYKIQRDPSTGNWWLIIDKDKVNVGYWPKELFPHLSTGASKVRFGGRTYAPPNMLSPPMGSGILPKEGYQYTSVVARLQHIGSDSFVVDVISDYMKTYNDANTNCYDLKYYDHLGDFNRAILFGGPGGRCDI